MSFHTALESTASDAGTSPPARQQHRPPRAWQCTHTHTHTRDELSAVVHYFWPGLSDCINLRCKPPRLLYVMHDSRTVHGRVCFFWCRAFAFGPLVFSLSFGGVPRTCPKDLPTSARRHCYTRVVFLRRCIHSRLVGVGRVRVGIWYDTVKGPGQVRASHLESRLH